LEVIVTETGTGPVLLYDGVCGFCNWAVQFVLARDANGPMQFSPLQSDFGEALKARHPELREVDSVIYLEPSADPENERYWVRSAAALRVASYLGGIWRLALVAYAIPAPVRDYLYDLFARNRYRVFGRQESCMVPSRDVRSRFIGEFSG
jgi:predicted DCC family thiol-disulfide oxidoreductase YuxK